MKTIDKYIHILESAFAEETQPSSGDFHDAKRWSDLRQQLVDGGYVEGKALHATLSEQGEKDKAFFQPLTITAKGLIFLDELRSIKERRSHKKWLVPLIVGALIAIIGNLSVEFGKWILKDDVKPANQQIQQNTNQPLNQNSPTP